jgi:hypothetical protein
VSQAAAGRPPSRHETAIATNRTDTMHPLLAAFGLEHSFDLVVTAADVANPKPHPEQLFRVAEELGMALEQLLYIGDSPLDEAAAAAADVLFVAYGNPDLTAAQAHIDSLATIPDLPSPQPGIAAAQNANRESTKMGKHEKETVVAVVRKRGRRCRHGRLLVSETILPAAIGTFPGNAVAGHAPDIFIHAFLAHSETAAAGPAERSVSCGSSGTAGRGFWRLRWR